MIKIKPFLVKTLELKSEEYPKFLLLFFHSFFLGLFIAFYFVPANAEFIKHFGTEWLPFAYIISGIAGYLSSLLYSNLQKRVNSRALFLGAILFMLCITLLSRLGVYLKEESWFFIHEKWVSFFVFIWAWPFISLVATESGGLAIGLLNLRQVKRLFGLINMGGVIASIISYLAIPFLLRYLIKDSYDLLFIAIAGAATSIFLLFIIYKRFPPKIVQSDANQLTASKTSFKNLFKEKYFILIFLSATLSMLVVYFTDFGFLATIRKHTITGSTGNVIKNMISFNSVEIEVSKFISLVYGALKIGELIMSYYSSRILSKYGVKFGLGILPLMTTILIIIAAITGLSIGATSILFFFVIVLSKSFERILRRSLDDPSFNILYQPLPDDQKLSIQTKVGVIMQISIGIAGGFLLMVNEILNSDNEFKLKFFPLLFLPILFLWLIIAIRLYNAYKENIRKILRERNQKKEIDTDIYGTDVLVKKLKDNSTKVVEGSVIFLSETNPRALELYAVSLLEIDNPSIRQAILKNINPTYRQEFRKVIKDIYASENSEVIKQLAQKALHALDYSDISAKTTEELEILLESKSYEDSIKLIKHLFLHKIPGDDKLIASLLDSDDKVIKNSAIKLAGKRDTQLLKRKLVRLLQYPEYSHIISSTLLEYGDKITDELEASFIPKTSLNIIYKIIEIYTKIGSTSTKLLLVSHLYFPDRDVQRAIIKALYYCQYQISIKDRPLIKEKVEEIVENILWCFITINDLEAEKNTLKIIQSLDLERHENFDMLFYLLSFIYQPATIDLIKTNIIGENTIFALEIIENFISQDIKQLIIPLFDKISVNQRMKKLNSYFPHSKLKFAERLKDIVKREYNKVDVWSVAKAIELLGKTFRKKRSSETATTPEILSKSEVWTNERVSELLASIKKSEIPDEIFVCLYHPDELIYSTAAKLIYDENPTRCINHLKELSPKKQKLIEILTLNDDKNLISERVRAIKRNPRFFSVPENSLVRFVKILRTRNIRRNEELSFFDDNNNENIFIILRGTLSYTKDKEKECRFTRNEVVIRGINIDQNAKSMKVLKDTVVLEGDRYEYFNMLVDEIDIINPMLTILKK